jgi:polysaccharide pyruvyl transferase WcaK-like protein
MVSERDESARINGVVNVLGWYNRNNIGDEIFKVALQTLFTEEFFQFDSEYLTPGCPTILGGGDVIKEYYLKQIKEPFIALGVGLGYPSEMDLIDKSLCRGIWFRNTEDTRAAFTKRLPANECPDLAFAVPPPARNWVKAIGKKKMAVILAHSVVNPKMGTDGFAEMQYQEYMRWELAKALDYLTEWYDISFIPMSHERFAYDETAHFEVASRMKASRAHVGLCRWSGADPLSFLRTLGPFDLVVSMKFHGLILATIMGIPFVNIGLTRKTSLYCEENWLDHLSVDPYSFTCDR